MSSTLTTCQYDSFTPMPLNFSKPLPLPEDWHITSYFENKDILIAHDTEYYSEDDYNIVLSHQLFCIDVKKRIFTDVIIYIEDNKRISMGELLAEGLSSLGYGPKSANKLRVHLLQHFGIAELSTLKDRKYWFDVTKGVRNCPVLPKTLKTKIRFKGRNYAEIKLTMMDTMLHAATGNASLKALGEVCSTKKIDIGKSITNMKKLLKNDKELFEKYACTDTRITVEYELRIQIIFEKLALLAGNAKSKSGTTLGGTGVNLVKGFIDAKFNSNTGPSFNRVFGFSDKKELEVEHKEYGTVKKSLYTPARLSTDPRAAISYFGGINVAYTNDAYVCNENEIVADIDLTSAYPTALAIQSSIDYMAASIPIHTIEDIIIAHTCLKVGVPHIYAIVDFDFPEDVQFPCIPVLGAYGLAHPLHGTGVPTTGVEIALAVSMGANVRLSAKEPAVMLQPLMFGNLNEHLKVNFTFADFMKILIAERRKHKKNTLHNRVLKEICNSIYGKTAQGIKHRLVEKDQPLRPSKITCASYAATCTGIVRAALLSIVNILSKFEGVKVLSATTDGCMCVVPKPTTLKIETDEEGIVILPSIKDVLSKEILDAIHDTYPIQAMLQGLRNLGVPDEYVLEIKHIGDFARTFKTRAYYMKFDNKVQFLAKGGISGATTDEMDYISLQDDKIIRSNERLPSFQDMKDGKYKDFVKHKIYTKVSLDFECKRIFFNEGFDSRPPKDISEIMLYRKEILKLHKKDKQATFNSLKAAVNNKQNEKQLRGATDRQVLMMLLTTIVKGVHAWHRGRKTYEELATIFDVSLSTVKRYKKSSYMQVAPDNEYYRKIVRDYALKLNIKRITKQMFNCILYPATTAPSGGEGGGSRQDAPPRVTIV